MVTLLVLGKQDKVVVVPILLIGSIETAFFSNVGFATHNGFKKLGLRLLEPKPKLLQPFQLSYPTLNFALGILNIAFKLIYFIAHLAIYLTNLR